MKFTESITTAYSFSDDLNDPKSDLFKEYASTLEPEMSQIMMTCSMMKSIDLQVTSFQAISAASETKAMAVFEADAEVAKDAAMEDVQGAVNC